MNINYEPHLENLDFKNCYVAGGAITSIVTRQEIADFDIYPKNFDGLVESIEFGLGNGDLVKVSNRALTFLLYETRENNKRVVMQVMTFDYFPNPDYIFKNFDFTVCMAAVDLDDYSATYHSDFWRDVSARTLSFNPDTKYPYASLLRTKKYEKRGYEIPKGEFLKIGFTCAQKGMPKNWYELAEQIGGVYGDLFLLPPEVKKSENDVQHENDDNLPPFTFENVMDHLSNRVSIVTDSYAPEKIEVKLEQLVATYDKTPHSYIFIPREKNTYFSTSQSRSEFLYAIPTEGVKYIGYWNEEITKIPAHWTKINPDDIFYGIMKLNKNSSVKVGDFITGNNDCFITSRHRIGIAATKDDKYALVTCKYKDLVAAYGNSIKSHIVQIEEIYDSFEKVDMRYLLPS